MTLRKRKNRDEVFIKEFGSNLRTLRKARKLSQEALANQSDLWLSIVGRIERGEIEPTLSTLKLLCKGLDITPSVLLDFLYSE